MRSIIALERLIIMSALEKAGKITGEAEKRLTEAKKISDQLPHKLEKEEISDSLKNIQAYGDKIRRAADLLAAPVTTSGRVAVKTKDGGGEIPEIGKPVWVLSLRREAMLDDIKGKRATVVIGNKRLTVPLDQIEPLREDEAKKAGKVRSTLPSQKTLPLFVDLHGLTVEEAIEKLDPYIDEAHYQGRERAHIIHGFGTGRLRKGIHKWLKEHQLVEKYELASIEQGGAGVTIVHLKKEGKLHG